MKLHPFYECAKEALKLINMSPDMFVHQQFNCAKCGTKMTMDTPNIFYKTGKCEECGHITDIEKDGCNYMVHAASSDAGTKLLATMYGGKGKKKS